MGIEVSANERQCLCSLPAVDARRFTSRLPWPPAMLLVSDYSSCTSSVAVCLSVRTVWLLSCQRSRWSISDKTRSAMKQNLADRNVVKPSDAKTLELKDEHWQLMSDLLPVLQLLGHEGGGAIAGRTRCRSQPMTGPHRCLNSMNIG